MEIQDPREAKLEHKRLHKIVQKRNGFRRALMLIFNFKNYHTGFILIQRAKKCSMFYEKVVQKGPPYSYTCEHLWTLDIMCLVYDVSIVK